MQAIKQTLIRFILRYVIIACAIIIIPRYVKGISVDSFITAIIVALTMGFLNSFVKPILTLIGLPLVFMTLGLFSLAITVAMVYVVQAYVPGFKVHGLIAPLIFSLLVGLTTSVVGLIVK